ncbi:hypothetical protein [Piscibacillus halophilus]|uniref:Uncharacterized protein n=1 Tax=Piscibacillus halophilus TaxID=571933 RepID=A0A1H9CA06_9BACI|nr:hypothetical protein [Piscibacillus halophilus]SEP98016.1 hypothetical protein SAMN05216362_1057 [Piscibacillus halophilus]
MKVTDQSLINKAKKYKKAFERYRIVNNHLYYKGVNFYMVDYKNRITKGIKLAIISDKDASQEDYEFAFKKIIAINNLLNSLIVLGSERSEINMGAYEQTKNFLEDAVTEISTSGTEKENLQNGAQYMNQILELHSHHLKTMEKGKQFIDRKVIDQQKFLLEDLSELKDLVAELDYLQYHILKTSREMISTFDLIKGYLEDGKYNKRNYKDVKQFVNQFATAEKRIDVEMKKINYLPEEDNMSKEEHKKAALEKHDQDQERYLDNIKEDTRNL